MGGKRKQAAVQEGPRNRNRGLRRVRVADIEDNPLNFRTHPDAQRAAFAGAVGDLGWYGYPDVYETETGVIRLIDGQLRKEHLLAKYGPEATVEVNVTDFDEAEAKKALATHDPLSAMAETDRLILDELLRGVETGDQALADMLSQLVEQSEMYQSPDEDASAVEDEVPDPPAVPITQPGDLWSLGNHRLLCGDSTNSEDVGRLMAGALAGLIFTDPPYNVAYVGKTKKKLKIDNDHMADDKFREFLEKAFQAMADVAQPGAAIYVCHADSEGLNFRSALIATGWLVKQCLIWVKNTMVLGRQDYQWKHEPILYGWKSGAAHKFVGGRKNTTVIDDGDGVSITPEESGGFLISAVVSGKNVAVRVPAFEVVHAGSEETDTVWRIDKPARNADHPTMKPVAIPFRAIRNSSDENDIVLDLFGGSGSTLSACQQLGRRSYSMEISPGYCDVIVARWEKLTGLKAELASA